MAEEFSTEELHSCLLKWLDSCLELGGSSTFDPSEVNDGNSLADCLVQLVPEFFTTSWRVRIISETGGNWKLKLNNLKKIQRSVQEYYDGVLHISLDKFKMPDMALVAEFSNKDDTASLIQLVLGIAINCDQKDIYIQAIMGMQQDVQHVVMGAIQDLMSHQTPSMVTSEDYKALEEENKQALQELEKLREEDELLQQQKHELSNLLNASQRELSDLNTQMEGMRSKLKEAQTSAGISGEGKAHQLQRLLDVNKTEKLKLETERDDCKQKCVELENQLQEVVEQNRNLTLENDEIPILRDSVEEMKYMESKVKNYESVISQYKKKVEDAQELRKQLKVTEDRNIMYMQQNMDLEEELRKQGGLKKQLESQRHRVKELENDIAQEKLRCLEATQEAEEKSQAVENLRTELMQVKVERDSLSQQVPGTPLAGEFEMFSGSLIKSRPSGSPASSPDLGPGGGGGGGGVGGLMEAFTPDMREKMVRLEKENQILRRRVETAESATQEGIGAVEVSGREKRPAEQGVATAEQGVAMERLRKDGAEWKQRAKEAEKAVKKYAAEVSTLEEIKKAKDVDIEKYKKYLNKAKKIIENIGENKSQGPDDSLEVQNLKTMVKEKDKQLEQLKKEHRQGRSAWEREEKLVVSAWHEMGLMMHRRFSQERLLSKQNVPFLAQQRQSLYKNPVPINASMASNISPLSATGDASHS